MGAGARAARGLSAVAAPARGRVLVASLFLVALQALLHPRERGLDLAQREPRGRQLAGQELGLGLRALVDEPVLLRAQPVALGLAVWRAG